MWGKRYDKRPDAVIVEGPMAGGHLGFSYEDIESAKDEQLTFQRYVEYQTAYRIHGFDADHAGDEAAEC